MNKINAMTISKALEFKGAVRPCSRCGGKKFSVVNGHSNFTFNNEENLMDIHLTGPSNIPIIFVICNKCGAITPHAIYGLIDKKSLEVSEADTNDKNQ